MSAGHGTCGAPTATPARSARRSRCCFFRISDVTCSLSNLCSMHECARRSPMATASLRSAPTQQVDQQVLISQYADVSCRSEFRYIVCGPRRRRLPAVTRRSRCWSLKISNMINSFELSVLHARVRALARRCAPTATAPLSSARCSRCDFYDGVPLLVTQSQPRLIGLCLKGTAGQFLPHCTSLFVLSVFKKLKMLLRHARALHTAERALVPLENVRLLDAGAALPAVARPCRRLRLRRCCWSYRSDILAV